MKFGVARGLLFCAIWIALLDGAQLAKTEDVLEKIKAGLQYASNYLETAKDIANLVSESLGHKQKQKQKQAENDRGEERQPFGPSNLASAFFRLIGFDVPKIAAVAVNSVIFIAQMISSLFGLKLPQGNIARSMSNAEHTWDPLNFILTNKNEKIRELVYRARDTNLPNQLISRMSGSDTACIRLLLCKSSPVIRAAQNSLNNKSRGDAPRIVAWLPSRQEFETNSDECEEKHTDCSLFPLR